MAHIANDVIAIAAIYARVRTTVKAFPAQNETVPLAQSTIQRRDVGPLDVHIDILYFGVCHSDLHQFRNEWHNTIYPCVPGHEIVGRVIKGRPRRYKV